METMMKAAILSPVRFLNPNSARRKPAKPPTTCCLRKNGDANSSHKAFSQLEGKDHGNADMSQERFRLHDLESEVEDNDIWKLFKEAQQNILYLNKQRLLALEELNKVNRDKKLLLERIEKLESENQASIGMDRQSFFWELLLRIDSMVLTGMINTGEVSDLRKVVLGYKCSVVDVFYDIMQKTDDELLAELHQFSDGIKKNGFHIIHICTEMEPLVVVGSLASYVRGLSQALQKRGHLVEVILPKYACLDLTEIQGLREIEAESYSYFNGQSHGNRIWTGVIQGIPITLIQPMYYASFFNRERVYGYSDDFERFSYFSRASLDYITKSGKQPDVLHIHNCETAIVGPLFWDIFVKQGLGGTKVLLTCHSFDSQCLERPEKVALCGLDPARLHCPDRLQDNANTHLINVLKGGIVYSNKVVILSSIHSKGWIIHCKSHGLESTLGIHKDKLHMFPYGFDNSTWDPHKDKFLPQSYSAEDMKGKAVCRIALLQRMGLTRSTSTILVGGIFSELLDFQVDNLKEVVQNASGRSVQFIFMASKMPSFKALECLQKELQIDEIVQFIDKYDEALSHLLFAGSDIILCQSFHDPLLQVPLKALRYGAVPVEVTFNENRDRNFADHGQETTTFLQFINSTFGNLSLSEAVDQISNNPSKWKQKIADAMSKDFSWDGECCEAHISAYTAIKNL